MEVLKDIWANYRDESFVSQFLSPHLIRQWRLFKILDKQGESELRVDAIHDERGYRRIRRSLAREYEIGRQRSEEHTSELQSLMRISYAVFCLKKNNNINNQKYETHTIK